MSDNGFFQNATTGTKANMQGRSVTNPHDAARNGQGRRKRGLLDYYNAQL